MLRRPATRLVLALLVAVGSLGLAACMKPDQAVVAFLLASDQADRWAQVDEPVFREHLASVCEGCSYVTYTARQDADVQAEQFEQALDDGADVVVLNAVDATRAAALVADHPDVPVIAYDRFVEGARHFVSVDPAVTGKLMADALVAAVGPKARVLMVNGVRTDQNAVAVAEAARGVFARHEVVVVAELDPTSWSAEAATKFVKKNADRLADVDAVFASNDAQAEGVVKALDDLGIKGEAWPWITGQDAELDAVRRVVVGRQGMTVYKQIRALAERAAELSFDVMAGDEPQGLVDHRGVPSVILTPEAVTRATLAQTVVRQRVFTLDQLCEGDTAQACAGLSLR